MLLLWARCPLRLKGHLSALVKYPEWQGVVEGRQILFEFGSESGNPLSLHEATYLQTQAVFPLAANLFLSLVFLPIQSQLPRCLSVHPQHTCRLSDLFRSCLCGGQSHIYAS